MKINFENKSDGFIQVGYDAEQFHKDIEKIVAETDESKTRDLTQLFNANQNKKTMIRIDKLSGLQDNLVDQFVKRIAERPDQISNKELMDGLKIVQDIIERGQKQVSGAGETPLIQVNQQNNEVTIGGAPSNLSRDSRERVKSAVMGLLNSLTAATPEQTPVDAEIVDLVDTTEEDNNGE